MAELRLRNMPDAVMAVLAQQAATAGIPTAHYAKLLLRWAVKANGTLVGLSRDADGTLAGRSRDGGGLLGGGAVRLGLSHGKEGGESLGGQRDTPVESVVKRSVMSGGEKKRRTTAETAARDAEFAAFWAAYPKRSGGNPRKGAEVAYWAARKLGASGPEILDGTRRYADYCEGSGKVGSELVKQARFWLAPRYEGWKLDWSLPTEPEDELARLIRQEKAKNGGQP